MWLSVKNVCPSLLLFHCSHIYLIKKPDASYLYVMVVSMKVMAVSFFPSAFTKWKAYSYLISNLLNDFKFTVGSGWQLTSDESWNTCILRRPTGLTVIRPTWKNVFYSPAKYVKSLMKTLRLHIFAMEPSHSTFKSSQINIQNEC